MCSCSRTGVLGRVSHCYTFCLLLCARCRLLTPLWGGHRSSWRQLDPAGPLGHGVWRRLHMGGLTVRRAADVHLHGVLVQMRPEGPEALAAALPPGEGRWRGALVDYVELVRGVAWRGEAGRRRGWEHGREAGIWPRWGQRVVRRGYGGYDTACRSCVRLWCTSSPCV